MGSKLTVRRETRQLPPLYARARVNAETIDAEKRTVEVTWTTGERVLRGFWDQFWEELSLDAKHVRMDRIKSGRAPVLDSHDAFSTKSVVGVIESARIEGKKGEKRGAAVLRFPTAEVDPEGDRVFRKIQDGILSDVSVGYRIYKMETVEETEGEVPVRRATDWEPFEISVVPIGADSGAKVRTDAGEANQCIVEEKMEEETVETVAETEGSGDEGGNEGGGDAAPAVVDGGEVEQRAARAATLAERKRVDQIQSAARKLGLPEAFAADHVRRGTPIADFRGFAIDAMAAAQEQARPTVHASIPAGGDARDKRILGMTNALLCRTGKLDMFRRAAEKRGDKADFDAGEYRSMSLLDIAKEVLEGSGVRTRGKDKNQIFGLALTQRSEGGFHAVGDFAVVLENTMHKTLLASYAITADTWERFCAVGTVSDFREHKRYRMGSFGRLDRVTENAEFQNKEIPDGEKESIVAETFGNIIGISRQALINDDMGALTSQAQKFGRAAKLSVEADVYDLLALNAGLGPTMGDGATLFHADHGNIGTSSTLSVAGLDADRVLMGTQMDPNGEEFLEIRPDVLLVPLGLGGQAKALNQAQYDITAGAVPQSPNIVGGLFRDIVDTARITGTRRYMFANPADVPTIEVAFLDGQREPFLEMKEGFRVDGISWKVRLDYGVDAIDWRGAVTNDGEGAES